MEITSSVLSLKGLRFHAFHGVLDQERRVGGEYVVDVSLDNVGIRAAETDNLNETVNYAHVIETVHAQMDQPSALIENVAARIAQAILDNFPSILSGTVSVTKVHPPLPGVLSGATYTINFKR